MTEDEARLNLENIVRKYLQKSPKLDEFINIVRDKNRPGLPIRGILEEMRKYRDTDYSKEDQDVIKELMYLYG
jgi:hypothetical protein